MCDEFLITLTNHSKQEKGTDIVHGHTQEGVDSVRHEIVVEVTSRDVTREREREKTNKTEIN